MKSKHCFGTVPRYDMCLITLSQKLKKPIFELTEKDFKNNKDVWKDCE